MVVGPPDPELGHDPVVDYAKIRCPLFLQWGAQDTSLPAEESAQRISAVLTSSRLATLRIYPEAEHMLNVTLTDVRGISTEEATYGFHAFRFAPGVRDDLRDWLRALF